MKHAGPEAIATIEPLLAKIRALGGTIEKKRGTFYRGPSAFLHFHEDPAGMFADLKIDGEFERFRVTLAGEQEKFVRRVGAALKSAANRR